MPYKIFIKHKILMRSGDYEAIIRGNVVVMKFEKKKVAESTYKTIQKYPQKLVKTEYDGDTIISQKYLGFKEKEILEMTVDQLDSAIKSKVPTQKLAYIVEELK